MFRMSILVLWVRDSSLMLGMTGLFVVTRLKDGRFAHANLPSFTPMSRTKIVIPNAVRNLYPSPWNSLNLSFCRNERNLFIFIWS